MGLYEMSSQSPNRRTETWKGEELRGNLAHSAKGTMGEGRFLRAELGRGAEEHLEGCSCPWGAGWAAPVMTGE